jgi:hypothetical protein
LKSVEIFQLIISSTTHHLSSTAFPSVDTGDRRIAIPFHSMLFHDGVRTVVDIPSLSIPFQLFKVRGADLLFGNHCACVRAWPAGGELRALVGR